MIYISEYTDIGSTTRGSIAIPLEPAHNTQVLDVTALNTQSEPFGHDTCVVTLLSDEDCLFSIGKYPDAFNGRKLFARAEKVISVVIGSGMKIAVTMASVESVSNMGSLESFIKLVASPADAQKQFAVMQASVDKMTASTAELRKASEEHAAIRDQLVEATNTALKAKQDAGKAASDLAAREAALSDKIKDYADKTNATTLALNERAATLEAGEADLLANMASVNKRIEAVDERATALEAKEAELKIREDAAAALHADYEARIAKFKALTA